MTKDNDSARPHLTIVGGQPRQKKQKGTVKVPVGMEKLLFHAAQNEEFKRKLLNDRQTAVADSGIKLRPSEEATLKVIPKAALETMIENIIPQNPRRRKFMGLVAAAAASLAAGTASNACDDAETETPDHGTDATMGIGSDTDVDGDTDTDTDTATDTDTDTNADIDIDAGTDGGDVWVGLTCDEDIDGI